MQNVLYILGAGFSASLGMPVMSNFLYQAKDMHASNPQEYKYFSSIFNALEKLSKVKNYIDCDLFNIEEILSILEMESFVSGKSFSRKITTSNYGDISKPLNNMKTIQDTG